MILFGNVFDESFSPNESQQSRSWHPFECQRFGRRCTTQRNHTADVSHQREEDIYSGGICGGATSVEARKHRGERVSRSALLGHKLAH